MKGQDILRLEEPSLKNKDKRGLKARLLVKGVVEVQRAEAATYEGAWRRQAQAGHMCMGHQMGANVIAKGTEQKAFDVECLTKGHIQRIIGGIAQVLSVVFREDVHVVGG